MMLSKYWACAIGITAALVGCGSSSEPRRDFHTLQPAASATPATTGSAAGAFATAGNASPATAAGGGMAAAPITASPNTVAAGAAGQSGALNGAAVGGSGAAATSMAMAGGAGRAGTAGNADEMVSSASGPEPSRLPMVKGTCPELKDGMLTVTGTSLQLSVGTKPGPMYFYWHATTQHYDEVERALPHVTADTKTHGGMVASFEQTNNMGTNTGNNVWYTGDFDAADQLLACGIQKGLIDTNRIYTAGYSAGGIQACAMVATHGSYIASAICYSGSAAVFQGTPKDKTHLPPVLLPHGAAGSDVLILDMAQQSVAWEGDYTKAGGFAIDCMDGGDHLTSAAKRMGLDGHALEFLNAHPYGIHPEPYAGGLPSGWPMYCKIVKQ
jgi:hypothetical protein